MHNIDNDNIHVLYYGFKSPYSIIASRRPCDELATALFLPGYQPKDLKDIETERYLADSISYILVFDVRAVLLYRSARLLIELIERLLPIHPSKPPLRKLKANDLFTRRHET